MILFCEGDLDATLRNHSDTISAKIDAIPKDQFLATPEDDLVEHVYAQLEVEPIVLHEDLMEMEQFETKVDVSRNRDRNPFGDRGPIYVPGVLVEVSIPYTGDSNLWKLTPNRWQSVFPRAELKPGHLVIVIGQPTDAPPDRIKQNLDNEIKCINLNNA